MSGLVHRALSSWPVLRLIEVIDRRSENRMTEFGMIAQAFEFAKINGIRGDYFEFGLWRGKTFTYADRMRRRYRISDVTLRGFDSFEGLPAHEDSADNIWKAGDFSCSEAEFRKIMRQRGIPAESYQLVSGLYEHSLTPVLDAELAGVKAAIVYIDCDLYESTRSVLRFIKKYLVNGSVVCFDDFYNNRADPAQGEARALDEFLISNHDVTFIPYMPYAPLGQSFLTRLKIEP